VGIVGAVTAIALNDSYVCSNEPVLGSVTDSRMMRGPGYRTINMQQTATIALSDGGIEYSNDLTLALGDEIKMHRCKSQIFGFVEYRTWF
jgi:putative component of toxin-antitoxin plasmid stabilization module